MGSRDDNLYAFDAAGNTRCSGGPPTKTCTPLWTAATGDWVDSSPAVVGGTVYVGSDDHKLYAFGCGHTLTGSHPGSVILSGGTWCVSNASVGGSLTITSGTTAVIVSSTVGGALNASRPGSLRVCSSTITGSVNVSGATGFVLLGDPVPGDDACGANTLRGAVTLSSGTAGTELAHNHAYSNVTVNGNSGVGPFPEDSRTEIEANTISGSLNCSGNTPAPTNDTQPNTVNGARTGQCGASGF